MTATLSVGVDLALGIVTLGGRRARLAPGGRPGLFLLGEGVRVRVIGFGERTGAVREALRDRDSEVRLRALLAEAVLEGDGGTEALAVALALAGGGEEAGGFEMVAAEAARATGWDWETIQQKPAIEVDRVVGGGPRSAGDGWNRIVFAAAQEGELEALCAEMTRRLLERGRPEAEGFSRARMASAAAVHGAGGGLASSAETAAVRPEGAQVHEYPTGAKRFALGMANAGASSGTGGVSGTKAPRRAIARVASAVPGRARVAGADGAPSSIRARIPLAGDGAGVPAAQRTAAVDLEARRSGPMSGEMPAAVMRAGVPQHAETVSGGRTGFAPPSAAAGHARAAAIYPEAAVASPPATSWLSAGGADYRLVQGRLAAMAPAARELAAPEESVDWLGAIAVALAEECDLRGIDG